MEARRETISGRRLLLRDRVGLSARAVGVVHMNEGWQRRSVGERRARYRRGISAEFVAMLALAAKGYRPIARRVSSPSGEIDLVVARGGRIAFVEVKRRRTLEAAEASISDLQRRRIRRAADAWLARHTRFQSHEISFDVVFVLPWRWPLHLPGAL